MAKALPQLRSATGPHPRHWRRVALWTLIAAAALIAWFWQPITARARAGASQGARVGCSCRYVASRDLAQCRADLDPGMGFVVLSADDAAKSVTARVPLLASQTASFRAGEGCVLERWSR